ncbi:MAG TPA: carbohydrate ABC transporter permease [Candidatus Dormibacteraeota bacterium]|nr:carbohydrate ABC transporter permease [Candidatus Dormibacteraeota bacterium]
MSAIARAARPPAWLLRVPPGVRLRRLVTHAALLAVGLLWVYPFLWALGSSLKSQAGFIDEGLSVIPRELDWLNYVNAWEGASFGTYFVNTVTITVSVVVLTLLLTSMAGYALARTSFPGKRVLLGVIVVTFFLPRGYTIVPVYDVVQHLGLLNTLWSVVLVQVASGMVFNTFLFMGYFTTVAKEVEEAARVDGAGFNQTFWYVMLPLARPMLATLGLFTFINSWNDFLTPLVFTLGQPQLRTLAVGLYAFISQTSTNWTALCAGSIISLAPIVLVFVVAQRHIVAAIAGAVKG